MWKICYKIIELRMKNLVYNISYYMITLSITDGNYYAACIKRRTKKPHRTVVIPVRLEGPYVRKTELLPDYFSEAEDAPEGIARMSLRSSSDTSRTSEMVLGSMPFSAILRAVSTVLLST